MIKSNGQDSSFAKFTGEQELTESIIAEALEKYKELFGSTQKYYDYYPPYFRLSDADLAVPAPSEGLDSNTPTTSDADDFSKTNTQVEGVDESDLIKTDGKYVYTVDNGTTVNIVDVRDKETPEVISQIEVDGAYVEGLYLHDDGKMTVISSGSRSSNLSSSVNSLSILPPIYDYNPVVNVTVFDISNPEKGVAVLETTEIEGSLLETRALNDRVYVATRDSFGLEAPLLFDENGNVVKWPPIFYYEPIPFIDNEVNIDVVEPANSLIDDSSLRLADPLIWPGEEKFYTYETEEQYLARIKEEGVLKLSLPSYIVTNPDGKVDSSGLVTPATEIYKPIDKGFSENLKTISVVDVTNNQIGIDFSTALPENDYSWDTLYMSTESLYLASPEWKSGTQSTELIKFDLYQDGTVDLVAEGEVNGSIVNQFALDEYEDNLRIATTTNDWNAPIGNRSVNNVYVLEQDGKQLNVIGETEDLAPGERIFSTRFDGDVGYVVTFRQVDPLFAIDLSDPTKPEVKSELKIPGFSEYLQVINVGGEDHLLGIGRDADPVTGRAGDLKVSLFDLEDLTKVTEVDNYIFPEEGRVWSPAAWEHHAVSYFPQWQVLALPFQSYSYKSKSNVQGLGLFQLDAEEGITRLKDIVHDRAIERSLRIGNNLVAFSDTKLTIHEFVDSEFTFKGEVDLPISSEDYVWVNETVFSTTPPKEALSLSIYAGTEDLTEIPETVYGTQKDDFFDSASPDERLFFGEGQVLKTRKGDDTVDVSQVGSNNTIRTGKGDDEIFTGTNNSIYAGAGNDFIDASSGSGNNQISVGKGKDRIVLVEGINNLVENTIVDFNVNDDLIELMNTGLSYADKGNGWDYTQIGDNVSITFSGQQIGLLLNTNVSPLTEANFVIS